MLKFSKITRYKINTWKSILFYITNNNKQLENVIKKIKLFIIAIRIMKCQFKINTRKDAELLYGVIIKFLKDSREGLYWARDYIHEQ